MEGRVWTKR